MDSNNFFLRNYPDDDALQNPQKYSKALSFSPDIIPLYGARPDQDALVHPNSWRGFTGMPIVAGDVNNVYIRGHGSGGPRLATLRVFPSELILWPQVWSTMRPVSSAPVVISSGDNPGPYASDGHLQFRPPHTTGNTYSLVAHVFKHDPGNEFKGLNEYEPVPSFNQNFGVDDLVSFISKDNEFTFYNVIVADPTLNQISASTRLRMFGASPIPVTFRVDWHKGTPITDGILVSLTDDLGIIRIPRAPLSSLGEYRVVLDPSYDGILCLNIFSPRENAVFEPYSGLSLYVFKGGDPSIASPPLLGALNVIFDPNSTRNLRFASPAARQLREFGNYPNENIYPYPDNQATDGSPIPATRPAATGWWFRNQTSDINVFPHTAPGGYTPDIQPIGTDLTVPGLWRSLQDPLSDYAKDHAIEILGGVDNYVFVRGHSTITDIDIQSRLFAVVGAPVLHPHEYTTEALVADVFNGDGKIDQQSISAPNGNNFYLFSRPFNLKAPPNPNPGDPNGGKGPWITRPHYCLIAEVRQKRKGALIFPSWPSEQVEDFKTLADFQNWVANNPLVCYRNLAWTPGTRDPGNPVLTWQCATRLVIPDSSFASTFWTIIVQCDNQIIPPECYWSLTCDDNAIFPNGVCFGNTLISTNSPAFAGCHFTGAAPGQPSSNIILTVTWRDRGIRIPPPSVKIRFAITEVSTLYPATDLATDPPLGSDAWPFCVGKDYPYLANQPNPSPLPSFTAIGPNMWPYPGSPQSVLGQVAFAATPESQ